MKDKLSPDQRIIYAVGAIALCCHEIEQHFKHIVPFANSGDPSLSAALKRREKLSKKPLGEVAEMFMKASSESSESFRLLVKDVIDKRNSVIHHFYETHGSRLNEGLHEEVISDLKSQHSEAVTLLKMLRELSLALVEVMRDTTFRNTEHYKELADACAKARAHLAS